MFSELDQENILLYYLEYEENLLDIMFQHVKIDYSFSFFLELE